MAAVASAQQPPANAQQPPVKVNVLNVCAPSADEQKELSSALAKVPAQAGVWHRTSKCLAGVLHSTRTLRYPGMQPLPAGAVSAADWVRVRREFPGATLFSNVQYSFSVDSKNMVETLVLRVREPKPRPDAGFDRRQRVRGCVRDGDVVSQYAGFARQTGALWKSVGGAGALHRSGRKSGDGSERVRTHLPRRLFDYGTLSRRSGRAQNGARGTGSPGRGKFDPIVGQNCDQGGGRHQEESVVLSWRSLSRRTAV